MHFLLVAGKFTGKFIKFPDGSSIHSECKDDFLLDQVGQTDNSLITPTEHHLQAEKCKHCSKGIAVAGGYSGAFFAVDAGKVCICSFPLFTFC